MALRIWCRSLRTIGTLILHNHEKLNVRIQKPALDWINQLIHVNLTSAHIEYVDKKSLSVSGRFFVAKLSPPPPGSHPKGVDKNRSIAERIRARSSWAPSYSRSWWSVYAPSSSSTSILCCSHHATGERQPDPGFYYLEGDDSSTLLDVAMVTARLSSTAFSSPSSSLHHFNTFLFSRRFFYFNRAAYVIVSVWWSCWTVISVLCLPICPFLSLWPCFTFVNLFCSLSRSLSIRPIILQHWSQTVFFSLFYGLHLCCPVFQVGRFCVLSDEILNEWKQFPN